MACHTRGTALFNGGSYAAAARAFSESIGHNDRVPGTFVRRGMCRYYVGNADAAFADFSAALRLEPNCAEAQEWLQRVSQGGGGGIGGGLKRTKEPLPASSMRSKGDSSGIDGGGKRGNFESPPQAVRRQVATLRNSCSAGSLPAVASETGGGASAPLWAAAASQARKRRAAVRSVLLSDAGLEKDAALWSMMRPAQPGWRQKPLRSLVVVPSG
ncbi:unnamed protein product [Phaeothamnion confervicola]